MAWTKEVKERRVSDRETELGRAKAWLEGFDSQKAEAETALVKAQERAASFTEEERAKRGKRVARAQRELDWALAAPVEGEDDDE